jgi:hypothetical protein
VPCHLVECAFDGESGLSLRAVVGGNDDGGVRFTRTGTRDTGTMLRLGETERSEPIRRAVRHGYCPADWTIGVRVLVPSSCERKERP